MRANKQLQNRLLAMSASEAKSECERGAGNPFTFSIRRIDTSNAQQVTVDFTPTHLETAKNSEGQVYYVKMRCTPTFNPDNDIFTPAFLLREDQLKIQRNPSNVQLFHDLHAHKLPDRTASSEHFSEHDIYVPRPSCSRFCHVCRVAYDDYLNHTEMEYHHDNLRKNKFTQDILKFCERMGQPGKAKPIRKAYKRNKKEKGELPCPMVMAAN